MGETWLITGSSRGLGRALVEAALDAGDQVVATARHPEQLAELAERYGDRVSPVALDVTDPNAVAAAVIAGVETFGGLDVGVYNVSRAVIPVLRSHGGGTIVQFSSVGGRVGGSPGIASYQAAKFAVDGFSRVLAAEAEPFGIRVVVVEPSGFATDWAGSSMDVYDVPDDYKATLGPRIEQMEDPDSPYRAGDPARAAEIIVKTVKRKNVPSHLLLGVNAVEAALRYSRNQLDEATTWRAVGRSADYAEPYPAEFPPDSPATA